MTGVIPARSEVTKTLKRKILEGFQTDIDSTQDILNNPQSTPEEIESAIVSGDDIKNAANSDVRVNRPTLSGDRRVAELIDRTVDDSTDLTLVRLEDLFNDLDAIVTSDSKQKRIFAKKLRSFAPLIQQLRNDGLAWQKVQLFNEEEASRRNLAERRGTIAQEVRPGDEYRAIVRALITNKATSDQLELVLNDEALKVSERVRKERLRSGSYVPLLVIGAGVHSSIFTSQLLRSNPDLAQNAVVIEPRLVLGGQFRAVGGVGFDINSRTRLHDYVDSEKNFPGETGNINSMGDKALVQLPDVKQSVYANNKDIGIVAAMNSFLSADTALGIELVKVRRNPEFGRDPSKGKYIAELRDVQTKEQIFIETDCVVSSTGLGEPILPFDEADSETQRILSRRKSSPFARGSGEVPDLPSVATSAEFWGYAANNRNWKPLEALAGKNLVIIGDGDSTQTILEKLHGILGEPTLDTQTGLHIASESDDKPITVTIIGAKQETYEGYIKGRRVRYHFVALFYPREDQSRNNDTITPLKGKASRLSTDFGRNVVCYIDEFGREQRVLGDLIITGTGFKDTSKEIFADFQDEYAGKSIEYPQRDVVRQALGRKGSLFNVRVNDKPLGLTILETEFNPDRPSFGATIFYSIFTGIGVRTNRTRTAQEFLLDYEDNTERVTFSNEGAETFEVLRDGARPIGRQVVSSQGREDIFVAGVAGKDYTFSDQEKESYPDATKDAVKILVNTDAIWRTAGGTVAMARDIVPNVLARTNWQKKVENQRELSMLLPEKLGVPSGERPRYYVLNLDKTDDEGSLPLNSNALDILKEALSRRLAKWRLDSGVAKDLQDRFDGDITIRFLRTYQDTYVLTIDPPLFPVSVLKEIFADLSATQVRDIRRSIKALLGSQGPQDKVRVSFPDSDLDSTGVQRVINIRPTLTLTFNYDSKNYNPVGEKRGKLDIMKNAQPDEKLEVLVGGQEDAKVEVASDLFGGRRVRSTLDATVRSALTGSSPVKEESVRRDERNKSAPAKTSGLREQLGVTETSSVTALQARELFNAGLLTFDNFFSLIQERASSNNAAGAEQDFNDLFKVPFTLRLKSEQARELFNYVTRVQSTISTLRDEYDVWGNILEKLKVLI